jgi:uncharacterized protein (DUF1800 family)
MPDKTTRRNFLRRLQKEVKNQHSNLPVFSPPETEDPLFKKYSRKTPGRVNNTGNNSNNNITGVNPEILRVVPVNSSLDPYGGQFSDWEKKHLINRLTVGFRKQDLSVLNGLSVSQAVDLLVPTQANAPAYPAPINHYQPDVPDVTGVGYGQTWINSPLQESNSAHEDIGNKRTYDNLRQWQIGSLIKSPSSITDKLVLFWYHFIPVQLFQLHEQSDLGRNSARWTYFYFKLLHDNCLGNFKVMIRQICTSPAMMNYLSNQQNTNEEPNENFARELLELFTLGATSGYSEEDVQQAARVLSGWKTEQIEAANTVTNFLPALHSQGNKSFSPFFNNTTITGRTGADGRLELDDLINMIFSKADIVAKFICRKLYRFFVYYDIDDTIENNVISKMAQTFISNNWEIRPVLLQLFKSQHFFDPQNFGVIIKSPLDYIAGFFRVMQINITPPDVNDHKKQYDVYGTLIYHAETMQQNMMNVPNVAGWRPYYQAPAFHQGWISSDSIQRRYSYVEGLLWGYNYIIDWRVNLVQWAEQFATPENPNVLVAETIKFLLPIDLSQAKRDDIKRETLLSGQTTDGYWNSLWTRYKQTPSDTSLLEQVNNRIRSLLFAITRLAEYQLM